ncbi:MAG TPA: PLP-dependent aminotransferase family protein [Vicinamibacterales bacterium]|nr:PLP-dependent aminotransferase family protein [Vicinamibacterales bacterium]
MIDYQRFLSKAAINSQASAIRKMGVMAVRPDMISFAPGYPDPATYAWQEFREIANELLAGRDASVLQYGPTRGYRPFVEALVDLLATRGIRATSEEVLITTGSQQGIDLAGRIMLDPGDVVLVELPAYTGAISAFRNTGARLVGVKQEADGIDLGDLEVVTDRERAAGRPVRFLYLVPNFQNPTGLLLSREKRRLLLEWASRADMLIVEDDPYGALYFEDAATCEDTRPLKADDEEGRVLYLSSFSKTLAPGFRVAWMTAPEPIVSKVEVIKQTEDLLTPSLDQQIVYEAYRRGILTERLPMLRKFYQDKRTVMEQALRRELGDLVSWPEPKGGFFLWASLPARCSTEAMLPRAIEERVIYVAGSAFFVDGTGHQTMRLSFSLPTHERIVEGVRRLSQVVRAELAGDRAPVEI